MPIKKGDKVKIEYEGRFDDGTVFDSSKVHNKPLEFEVGAGQVIKGFEDAIIGMEKNEEKEIKLNPDQAYGEHNPKLVQEVPKEQLPPEVKAGMVLMLGLPDGSQVPVVVKEVKENSVILDLNHPLAGKVLNFKIKVLDIAT